MNGAVSVLTMALYTDLKTIPPSIPDSAVKSALSSTPSSDSSCYTEVSQLLQKGKALYTNCLPEVTDTLL